MASAILRQNLLIRLTLCLLGGMGAMAFGHAAHALTLDELEPAFAAVGEEVELTASGLDPIENYTLTVAGSPATVISVEIDRLRFIVPAGASSGPVELGISGDPSSAFQAPFALTVVRPLDASIDPSFGSAVSGYALGTAVADAAGAGPNFSIDVPIGNVALAIAAGSDAQSLLFQVVTDSTTSAVLTAQTTAQALVFNTPTVQVADLAEAIARLATIDALPETAALAQLVSSAVADGRDYLDDAAFRGRFLAATRAFEETDPSPPVMTASSLQLSEDFSQGRSFASGYPRDLAEASQLSLLNRLDFETTSPGVSDGGVPNLGIKWNATEFLSFEVPFFGRVSLKGNPVDWIAGLYLLDAEQFPGGINEVNGLTADGTAYTREQALPLAYLIIPAKDPTGIIDIRDTLISLLVSRLKPVSDLRIPSDRSSLYMVRKFSGAHYPAQEGLIDALPDGQVQASRALALNLFIAALDTIGLFSPKLGGANRKDLVRIGFDVYLTMERVVEERRRDGVLSADDLDAIRQEGLSLFLRKLRDNAAFFTTRTVLGKIFAKGPKFFGHIAKVATVGKIASRSLALWNFPQYDNVHIVQGVESTAVVVGDPWRPEITSFSPRKGHLGTVVTLHGKGFSATPEDNAVEFNAAFSTDPTALPARPAEVIEAAARSLIAAVPVDAERGSGSISIQRVNRGKFYTSENQEPFDLFEVLPQPIVTAIEPNLYIPGGLVRIVGSNFSEDMTRNIVILRDSVQGDVFRTEPLASSTTEILFRDPSFPGELFLRVQVEDVANPDFVSDASNEIAYNRRPAPSGSTGTIRVTTYLDNVTPDHQITLREAIHIGAGTLGRPLTTCDVEPGATVGCERENVDDNDGFIGVGVSESIIRHALRLAEGGTINLALGALPGIEGGDNIGMLAIVDGGGGAFSGLTINGESRVGVSFLQFKNFGEHGIHLIDAPEARIANVLVEDCGGTGMLLEGNSSDVQILDSAVINCRGHGLHLSGAGVQRVLCSGGNTHGMVDNGGDGILLSGGTSANQIDCGTISRNAGAGINVVNSSTNSIGNPARSAILRNKIVANNGGPGVAIAGSGIRVFRLDIRGNGSHGIVIGGSQTTGVEVQSVMVGPTRDETGSVDPNMGHGILIHDGASNITIGTRAIGGINEPPGSMVSGNTGFGILITGPDTTDIRVNRVVVGGSLASDFRVAVRANALGGIALQDFTHDNLLGDATKFARLDIVGHTTTVGILIEGGAHHNRVFGTNFGTIDSAFYSFASSADHGNFYGIRIRGGAHSNIIGARGSSPFLGNSFRFSAGAAVLLESGGSVIGTQTPGVTPTPENANVLINNAFGSLGLPNEVGVILREGAEANRIGGVNPADANSFHRNTKAGLWIDNYAISKPHLANRIIGNSFSFMLGEDRPPDPLVAVPDGIGVLLTNASGHVIGGTGAGEGNSFFFNNVGIYDKGGSGNRFEGNDLKSNQTAGIILATTNDSIVGPNNEISNSGRAGPGPAVGGIAIKAGSGNRVFGNAIGTDRGWTGDFGNFPQGILLADAAQTVVGALELNGPNVIGNNLGAGILIEGAGATDNQVINNWIGEAPTGFPLPNAGSGVELRSGANDNEIGDEFSQPRLAGAVLMPAGNRILGNAAHGVHIHGAATVSNTVTNNSISDNTLAGIRLEGGGNNGLPAPTITSYNGQRALGTVAGGIPDGSLVQLFSDADGEGLVLVGEGPVVAGRFAVVTGFVSDDLTATLTDKSASALVGRTDTSEFAAFFPASIALSVLLASDPQTIPSAAPGALGIMALPLELMAINGTVKVQSLTFDVQGSLTDNSDILQVLLYRDIDGDGRLGDDDEVISDPGSFAEDNGSVTLSLGDGVSVDTLSSQTWLVVLDLSPGAVLASNVELSLLSAASVTATVMLSPSIPVPVIGTFPIASDEITLIEGSVDSDSDGVVDVADICPGTLVGDGVDEVGCSCDQLDIAKRFPTGDLIACPEPRAEVLLLTALGVIVGLRGRRGGKARAIRPV